MPPVQADAIALAHTISEYDAVREDAEFLREYMESARSYLAHVAAQEPTPLAETRSLGARAAVKKVGVQPLSYKHRRDRVLTATTSETGFRNRLLSVVPPDELGRMKLQLVPVTLRQGETLVEPGELIQHAYFPETAVMSFMTRVGEHAIVEVGSAGYEGLVGLPLILSGDVSPYRVLVQMPGNVYRMEADALKTLAGSSATFNRFVLRYAQAFMMHVANTMACSAAHLVLERCATWLLTTQDRVAKDEFPLRYEFLACTLGVRANGATIALRRLEDAGVLRYDRGRVGILDRARLEESACPCYRTVRAQYDRMLTRDV